MYWSMQQAGAESESESVRNSPEDSPTKASNAGESEAVLANEVSNLSINAAASDDATSQQRKTSQTVEEWRSIFI